MKQKIAEFLNKQVEALESSEIESYIAIMHCEGGGALFGAVGEADEVGAALAALLQQLSEANKMTVFMAVSQYLSTISSIEVGAMEAAASRVREARNANR